MGADAAGWLHHGMANRLCLDMGLSMDPARLEKTITMSAREIRLRRQIYWTLYFHDKLCASYTGRICSMLVCTLSCSASESSLTNVGCPSSCQYTIRKRGNPGYNNRSHKNTHLHPQSPHLFTKGHVHNQHDTREDPSITVSYLISSRQAQHLTKPDGPPNPSSKTTNDPPSSKPAF